ncbi:DUF4304 domain-containing protein [Coraliomargarita sp. W4R53]
MPHFDVSQKKMPTQKSATTQAINTVSKDFCLPALKEAGFKRRSPHIFREKSELIHAIHFQASQWGSQENGSFTVNLCVTVESLYRFWTGKPLPKNPATAGWPIQVRLGDVCPEGHDLWWDIDAKTNLQKIGEDVSTRLTKYALPFFEDFQAVRDIRTAINSKNPPAGFIDAQAPLIESMILSQEGDVSEARKIILAQTEKWKGHPFLHAVTTIGERILNNSNG